MPKASQIKFHQVRITKSKVIQVQIPVPKWEKKKKWESLFWVAKWGNKGIANRGKFQRLHIPARGITNRGNFRDLKSRQKVTNWSMGFKSGKRDFKSGQRLQIGGVITIGAKQIP